MKYGRRAENDITIVATSANEMGICLKYYEVSRKSYR